jgi:hypothetical protein
MGDTAYYRPLDKPGSKGVYGRAERALARQRPTRDQLAQTRCRRI